MLQIMVQYKKERPEVGGIIVDWKRVEKSARYEETSVRSSGSNGSFQLGENALAKRLVTADIEATSLPVVLTQTLNTGLDVKITQLIAELWSRCPGGERVASRIALPGCRELLFDVGNVNCDLRS